ncbi:MAG: hypothetical protein U0670_15040 [Anaerolineae bacterium]
MTSSNPLRLASRILIAAAALILFGYLLVYIGYAVNLIQFPFDYDQGEGFELVDTVLFSQGQFPYRNTDAFPFYSSNYPPLFHVIAAPFVWLFGPAYWYGRLLGFLGTLVTASAIGLAVLREGRRRDIALLAGLAFLASNTIYHIGPLFRQHMTMVMFETLAVVILAGANEIEDTGRRRRVIALGLALILCAGYTKQLAIFTAVAAFAFLFIRQPRRAVVAGIGFALVGGLIFVWMNWATQGEWWRQAIRANVNTINFDQTVGLFRLWWNLHGFLIVPAVLLVVYQVYFDRISIYALWFAASLGQGVLSGTWGGGDSYFATSIAALCVLSGIFIAKMLNRDWAFEENYLTRLLIRPLRFLGKPLSMTALIVLPVLYIGYGYAVLHLPTQAAGFSTIASVIGVQPNALNGFYDSATRIVGGYADIGHYTTQSDIDAGWRIVAMIRDSGQLALSEEAGFQLQAGQEVVTNPTQLLNLANNGIFNGEALIGMIERREFGVVILRAQFYPIEVLQAIMRNYIQTETVPMNGFDYLVLRPREG